MQRVEPAGRGARVLLTAYYFTDAPPIPDRSIERFSLPPEVERAGDTPKALEIRRLHAELTQRLPEINEALRLRSRSELMDARYHLFEKTLRQVEAQRWSEVIAAR